MRIFAFVRLHFRFHLLSRLFPKRTPTHSWQKPSNTHIHRTQRFSPSFLSPTLLLSYLYFGIFLPVSHNREANMRADKFGRKPLTGIIRVEVEERGERGGGQDERRRRVEAEWPRLICGATWPPPGWVSSLQRAGKGSRRMEGSGGKRWRWQTKEGNDVFLQMHHGRKEWSEPFDNTRKIKWKRAPQMKGNRRLTQTATN